MCGICGIVGVGAQKGVERMTLALAHRGPDDIGVQFFPEENLALGHRRLSIIDLSPAGHQPMSDESGDVWIAFNGEIYNFPELREKLREKGHQFRSHTDTEVILQLYKEEGVEGVRRLNGMFAFALLDRQHQKLILARDHFGIKPLYYYHANGCFAFGSEIKAILSSGVYSPDINWQALYDYFTFLYVPCPQSIFRGILQVPPAHVLELDLRTNQIEVWRYWRVSEAGETVRSSEEYDEVAGKEILRSLLADSVRHQMMSDVPLGVFLSGGVDSPILTGLMAQHSSQPVKTFTVIFQGKDIEFYNERETARVAASKFGTDHHEIPVDLGGPTEMLNLVESFDQPFGNPTFYLMYLISKHTRAEVKVALCGAGGDELFAGYPRYQAMTLAHRLRWAPQPLLSAVRSGLGLIPDDYRTMTLRRARLFLKGLDKDFARQFVKWTYFFDEVEKGSLLQKNSSTGNGNGNNDSFLPSDRIVRQCLDNSPLEDFGNRVLDVDMQTFLLDNILEYTDKMSMAVSLEVRVPYLDRRVVEHSLRIPFHKKLRGSRGKIILKEAFSDLLPEVNREAPKKGFNFPLAIWMRDYLDGYFDQNMSRAEVNRQGIFNWEYIQLLRQQHQAGKQDRSYELFSIIMFDVWYRRYLLQQSLPERLFEK